MFRLLQHLTRWNTPLVTHKLHSEQEQLQGANDRRNQHKVNDQLIPGAQPTDASTVGVHVGQFGLECGSSDVDPVDINRAMLGEDLLCVGRFI